MSCYCLQNLISINNLEFKDGEKHCMVWFKDFFWVLFLIYGTPLLIVLLNFLLKTIVRKLSPWEKRRNKTIELIQVTIKMFMIQFLNTAVILLVVNGGIPYITYKNGSYYEDFSVGWYREVGSTINLAVLLSVFTPHFASIGFGALKHTRACFDRGCSCNKKKTKKFV